MATTALAHFPCPTESVLAVSPNFGITRFSLTNPMRDSLRDAIAPFVEGSGVPPSPLTLPGKENERRAALKAIAETHFPRDKLDQLRDTMHGDRIDPFVVENLPRDTWDDTKEARYRKKQSTRQLMVDVISEAICAATQMDYQYHEVLVRKVEDHLKHKTFKGMDMHTDPYDVSMLSALTNEEHAGLKLIDLASVLKAMPLSARGQIAIMQELAQNMAMDYGCGTLADIDPQHHFSYSVVTIDREDSDPKALELFDALVKKHTIELDLQPGQLLCVSNKRLYHQGARGTLQPAHTDPAHRTRVLAGSFAMI